jgi:hypothetical protein
MADSSTSWLADFLAQLFRSPSWEVPLMNFIDDTCAIFDSDDENKLVYTEAHADFCSLVEQLLESHLGEIGLTAEDFAAVSAAAPPGSPLRTIVLEQVLACEDFATFKKLMVRRSAELNLEAIETLAVERAGLQVRGAAAVAGAGGLPAVAPSAPGPANADAGGGGEEEEEGDDEEADEDVLRQAIAMSLLGAEHAAVAAELEVATLESHIAASNALTAQDEEVVAAAPPATTSPPAATSPAAAAAGAGAVDSPPSPRPRKKPAAASPRTTLSSAPLDASSSLKDLPNLPGMGASARARPLGPDGDLPPVQPSGAASSTRHSSSSSLPSLAQSGKGGPSSTRADLDDHNAELDALLLGHMDGASSSSSAPLPAPVRRADDYLVASRQRAAGLREVATKREADMSAKEVEARSAHLRDVRDALRTKAKADRERALAEAGDAAAAAASANAATGGGSGGAGALQANVQSAMAAVRAQADEEAGGAAAGEEEKRRAMRHALAAKLKADVIRR